MASTRNKNTECNYRLEMRQYQENETYTLYAHSSHGAACDTRWAGNGLNPGQIPVNQLSKNGVDLESFLFGIGSTNLVDMANPSLVNPCCTKSITPELRTLKQCNVYDSRQVVVPKPMIHNPYERPFSIP